MPRLLLSGLITTLALAACSDASRLPTAPDLSRSAAATPNAGAASDPVTASEQWNLRTRLIIARRGGTPNDAARAYALVSVAQYDAVIAAVGARRHGAHPSEAGAAATASAVVLASLYPAEQHFVDSALAVDAAYYPTLPSERENSFDAGGDQGRTVAAAVIAYAATDGSAAVWSGTVPVGAGFCFPLRRRPCPRARSGARCVRGS